MLPTIRVEEVWYYMPADVRKPDEVAREGQGGVTQAAFEHIKNGVMAETTAILVANGVRAELWGHDLVKDYMLMQVAARILRRIRVYQEVANSLFADSNIRLRNFLEGVVGIAPDVGEGRGVDEKPLLPPF